MPKLNVMLFPGVTESFQIILASYMVGSLGADALLKAYGLHLVPRKPKKNKKVFIHRELFVSLDNAD